MSITASCGHTLTENEELVDVRIAGEDCDAVTGFHRCITYAVYCPACGAKAKTWPEWLETEEDADRYMRGGILPNDSSI